MEDSVLPVAMICRVCGKIEYVAPWSPLLLSEVCARPHKQKKKKKSEDPV